MLTTYGRLDIGVNNAGLKARPNCIDYASAKAAIHHATKCLSLEFGPYNIRVNAIAPGYIDTPMSGMDACRSRHQS